MFECELKIQEKFYKLYLSCYKFNIKYNESNTKIKEFCDIAQDLSFGVKTKLKNHRE